MGRLLVISDIHGHYKPFVKLMDLVKYHPKQDTLIVLGDLIDRGPQSSDVVRWFLPGQPGEHAIVVRGNHEEGFLRFLQGKMDYAAYVNVYMGGIRTIQSYESISTMEMSQHLLFLEQLPYYHRQDGFIFVHAGMNTHKALEYQEHEDVLYADSQFFAQSVMTKCPDDIIVFGHTPTGIIREKLKEPDIGPYIWYDRKYRNKIGIDCGNQRRKRLACLDLTNCIEYYQPISKNEQVEIRTTKEALKYKEVSR